MNPNLIKPKQYLGAFVFILCFALAIASVVAPHFNFNSRFLATDFFQWFQLVIFMLAGIGLMQG